MKKRLITILCVISMLFSNAQIIVNAQNNNIYLMYYNILEDIVSEYGYSRATTIYESDQATEIGLVYAKMIDFDNDGTDELYLQYVTKNMEPYALEEYSGEYILNEEVWNYDNNTVNKIFEYEHMSSGEFFGYNTFGTNIATTIDNKKYIYSFGQIYMDYDVSYYIYIKSLENNEFVYKAEYYYQKEGLDTKYFDEYTQIIDLYQSIKKTEYGIEKTNEIFQQEYYMYEQIEDFVNSVNQEFDIVNIEKLAKGGKFIPLDWTIDTTLIQELENNILSEEDIIFDVYMPYTGDYSKFDMSTKQAYETIELINTLEAKAEDSEYYGYKRIGFENNFFGTDYMLFDSGDGIPGLFSALGIFLWENNEYIEIELYDRNEICIYEDKTVFIRQKVATDTDMGTIIDIFDNIKNTSKSEKYIYLSFMDMMFSDETLNEDMVNEYINRWGYDVDEFDLNHYENHRILTLNGKSIELIEFNELLEDDSADYYTSLYMHPGVDYGDFKHEFVNAQGLLKSLNDYIDNHEEEIEEEIEEIIIEDDNIDISINNIVYFSLILLATIILFIILVKKINKRS